MIAFDFENQQNTYSLYASEISEIEVLRNLFQSQCMIYALDISILEVPNNWV